MVLLLLSLSLLVCVCWFWWLLAGVAVGGVAVDVVIGCAVLGGVAVGRRWLLLVALVAVGWWLRVLLRALLLVMVGC